MDKASHGNSSNQGKGAGNSLYLESIPLSQSYETVAKAFGKFGQVKEIRVSLVSQKQVWEDWVTFLNQDDALKACREMQCTMENANCFLVEKTPT